MQEYYLHLKKLLLYCIQRQRTKHPGGAKNRGHALVAGSGIIRSTWICLSRPERVLISLCVK